MIPYGAGTSLEGHVLAVYGGVTMDLTLMDKLIELNKDDMTVKVGGTSSPHARGAAMCCDQTDCRLRDPYIRCSADLPTLT